MKKSREQQKKKSIDDKKGLEGFDFVVMPKVFEGKAFEERKKKPEKVKEVKPKPKPEPKPKPLPVAKIQKPKRKMGGFMMAIFAAFALLIVGAIVIVLTLPDAEEEIAQEINEPEISPEPIEPEIIIPGPGEDTDSDGLTDIEERLYGSEYRNPDSDADSFLDGNEVFHGFDPVNPDPALLSDSTAIELYEHEGEDGFSFLRPKTWLIERSSSESGDSIRLSSGTDATFIINILPNTDELDFEAFFNQELSTDYGPRNRFIDSMTKLGLIGIETANGRLAIYEFQNSILVFEYDLGSDTSIEYLQTFKMLMNSVK